MENYVTLMGAEKVSQAGSQMSSAAEEIKRAVGNFDHALFQHRQFLNDWLARFESVLQEHKT